MSLKSKKTMKETNLEWALEMLKEGKKVRLPEWRGYWYNDNEGETYAITKDGEVKIAWISLGDNDDIRRGFVERKDWEIAEGLDFGWAICALKAGKLVTRKGWNGKKMFLFIRPSDELDTRFIIDQVKSLPQSLKNYYDRNYPWADPKTGVINKTASGPDKVKFSSYICMKAADGTIVNGWLASQTDMLAEDWQLFKS
jgi:hypothetical protein